MAEVLIKYIDRDDDEWDLQADDSLGGGVVPEHSVVKSVLPAGAATSANQATTHTKLDAVISAVDGVEGKLDAVVSAVEAVEDAITAGGGSFIYKVFQNTDVDGSDEVLGASETCIEVRVKNISTGGQKVYVIYTSQATATTANAYELAPGEADDFPGVTNVTDLHVIASAANAAVCYRTKNPA